MVYDTHLVTEKGFGMGKFVGIFDFVCNCIYLFVLISVFDQKNGCKTKEENCHRKWGWRR